jgi:exosortase
VSLVDFPRQSEAARFGRDERVAKDLAEGPSSGKAVNGVIAAIDRGSLLLLAFVFLWAYWTTFVELVGVWLREPDYSHGFLVVPLALGVLWLRRDRYPGFAEGPTWLGVVILLLALGLRLAGAGWYVDALDDWSIPVWIAGAVALVGGWPLLRWSLPSVVFLGFMVPLPWHVEQWVSQPLQRLAVNSSCAILQCLGQPALAEGNAVLLGDLRLEVAPACCGMRICMGVIALAVALAVLLRRTWLPRMLLVASALPVALIATCLRIIAVALLQTHASGQITQQVAHDVAGWAMIPLAAVLFGLVAWYLSKLLPEGEATDVRSVLREPSRPGHSGNVALSKD